MNIIEVNNLKKSYGKGDSAFKALDNINLDIKEGESLAITGKSGSGKSTLMHILALLDQPSSGTVLVDNKKSTDLKPVEVDNLRNKNYGFVFQQFFLNGNDTVLNNVILPLKIARLSKKIRNKRGLEVLKSVDLLDKAHEKANNLSGGQKQRVCIARALVNEPKVIFADEPTGNLDSTTGQAVEDLLFSLNKSRGITLIIVTHDADLAKKCDRKIDIKDGRILS